MGGAGDQIKFLKEREQVDLCQPATPTHVFFIFFYSLCGAQRTLEEQNTNILTAEYLFVRKTHLEGNLKHTTETKLKTLDAPRSCLQYRLLLVNFFVCVFLRFSAHKAKH